MRRLRRFGKGNEALFGVFIGIYGNWYIDIMKNISLKNDLSIDLQTTTAFFISIFAIIITYWNASEIWMKFLSFPLHIVSFLSLFYILSIQGVPINYFYLLLGLGTSWLAYVFHTTYLEFAKE